MSKVELAKQVGVTRQRIYAVAKRLGVSPSSPAFESEIRAYFEVNVESVPGLLRVGEISLVFPKTMRLHDAINKISSAIKRNSL